MTAECKQHRLSRQVGRIHLPGGVVPTWCIVDCFDCGIIFDRTVFPVCTDTSPEGVARYFDERPGLREWMESHD